MTTAKVTRTKAYDSAGVLDTPVAIQTYMDEALATGDPAFVAFALGTVARARGMARVAKKAGLSRESLYKALNRDGNPGFATVMRVMEALDLSLSVQPVPTQRKVRKAA
jgi:probable addiction module antidote protein